MKRFKYQQVAGSLLFLAGLFILIGIIIAEAFHPGGYSTAKHEISDLGSTREGIIYQPTATIFNTTMLVTGCMIFSAFIAISRFCKSYPFLIPFCLFGIAVTGVGLFPGNVDPYHGIFALLSFTMGSLSAITSYKLTGLPLGLFGAIIGVSSLVFLFGANLFIPFIGMGGTERMIVYPIVAWLIGFGGYLLGTKPSIAYREKRKKEKHGVASILEEEY